MSRHNYARYLRGTSGYAVVPAEMLHSLADMLDPTCRADETDWLHTKEVVHVCECSVCGGTFEYIWGEYEYCPRCGARIVGGGCE